MYFLARIKQSIRPASIHLAISIAVSSCLAVLIFRIWYPYPYDKFSGGIGLFFLLMCADITCGPLLTLVLYTKSKPIKLWYLDIGLIVILQITALAYGVTTAWNARPMYLVAEIDRFKVITQSELKSDDINKLPPALRVGIWNRPLIVGVRPPISIQEKNKVLFESIQGGRDYAERPEFYISYNNEVAKRAFEKARPLSYFLQKYPNARQWVSNYSLANNIPVESIKYFPIIARQDWIAVLDSNGYIAKFAKGDGF